MTKLVGKKLVFAEPLSYSPCKGYERSVANRNPRVILPPELVYDGDLVIPFGSTSRICQELQVGTPSSTSHEVLSPALDSINDTVLPNEDLSSVDFESMVDRMVEQIYSYGRCLSFKHNTSSFTNDIQCKGCFHYGHIKKNCLNSRGKNKVGA
jgi:hypothetical protein